MFPHKTILLILLFSAALSPSLALVPRQPKQVTRGEVVQRLANAALHPARPRRSSVPGDCTTLPTGIEPDSVDEDGLVYNEWYSGSGFTENPNNPGNDHPELPPRIADIGFLDIPDAVQKCTDLTFSGAKIYFSFDLHFLISTCTWICVQYSDFNDNINTVPTYWDQANPDVAIAFGYSP